MNCVRSEGSLQRGDRAVRLFDPSIAVPEIHEDGVGGQLALGIRPEHVMLSDDAPNRGRVFGTEYLGTTQIVTIEIEQGQIKARLPARLPVRLGATPGPALPSHPLLGFAIAAR